MIQITKILNQNKMCFNSLNRNYGLFNNREKMSMGSPLNSVGSPLNPMVQAQSIRPSKDTCANYGKDKKNKTKRVANFTGVHILHL